MNRQVKSIILAQLGATAAMVLLALLIEHDAWMSALAGGMIAVIINALFAISVFGKYSAQAPETMVHRFYGAEIMKLATAAMLFLAAIKLIEPLNGLALFGVFFVVQLMPVAVFAGRG